MIKETINETAQPDSTTELISSLTTQMTELAKSIENINSFTTELQSSLASVKAAQAELQEGLPKQIEDIILSKLPPINTPPTPTPPNSGLTEFLNWANKREDLQPQDPTFFVYEESYIKALAMAEPLKNYIDTRLYPQVLFSLTLHYIIVEDYEYKDDSGFTMKNPLYKKYNIASKSFIVSSASDESSSSSIHTTKSLNEGDFTMQDLIRTKYGMYVYQILEQLDVGAVLL